MEYLPLPIAALVAYYKITDTSGGAFPRTTSATRFTPWRSRFPPRHRSAQGVRRFALGRRI